jgi:hypothetical protein
MKAKTHALDDIIVVVMCGSGFTPPSRRSWTAASPSASSVHRDDSQGARVPSQAHVDPDITIKIVFVDAALDRLGAVEVPTCHHSDRGRPAESVIRIVTAAAARSS